MSFEGSPEPFDSGGSEDVLRGAKALGDSETSGGLDEDFPVNSVPWSVRRDLGAPQVLAAAPGFFSKVETARGAREKASKTEAR